MPDNYGRSLRSEVSRELAEFCYPPRRHYAFLGKIEVREPHCGIAGRFDDGEPCEVMIRMNGYWYNATRTTVADAWALRRVHWTPSKTDWQ